MSRIANDSMACCEEEADGMRSIAPNRPRVLMHNATREENVRFHEDSPQLATINSSSRPHESLSTDTQDEISLSSSMTHP